MVSSLLLPAFGTLNRLLYFGPLNIQPVVVVRGLKRQLVAALTNFVGCFFSLSYFFFPILGAE